MYILHTCIWCPMYWIHPDLLYFVFLKFWAYFLWFAFKRYNGIVLKYVLRSLLCHMHKLKWYQMTWDMLWMVIPCRETLYECVFIFRQVRIVFFLYLPLCVFWGSGPAKCINPQGLTYLRSCNTNYSLQVSGHCWPIVYTCEYMFLNKMLFLFMQTPLIFYHTLAFVCIFLYHLQKKFVNKKYFNNAINLLKWKLVPMTNVYERISLLLERYALASCLVYRTYSNGNFT